ncbi:VRR-NUC domain-containing protein [Aerococcaceae bacterium NML191219]|nr:VRR-NUC domain-containing protein [Aerococcaceae bacterium NML191219]
MLEKEVERHLVKAIKAKGGLCLKFNCLSMAGVPDRIVLLPYGQFAFVEVKAPGKKLRALQVKRKQQFEKLGFKVFIMDELDKVNAFIDEVENGYEVCST